MSILDRVKLREARLAEIIALRHEALVMGTNRTSAELPGDGHLETRHFGAFLDDEAVGCLTFVPSKWLGNEAWQLRGMATRDSHRGCGIGRSLLAFAQERLHATSSRKVLWCNARVGAIDFYRKQDWVMVSAVFEIPGVGAHVKMTREFEPDAGGSPRAENAL